MPIAPATLAAFKELVATTADLDKRIKKLDAEVVKREGKIREAIAGLDTTVLETQLKAIEGDIAETTALLHDADMALIPLDTLQKDEAFMQERDDDADKLSKVIANTRNKTAQHFKSLKKLQNDAEDAWRKSLKSENFALRRLARLDESVKDLRKRLKERFAKLDKAAQRATAAHEARDAKALAAARAEVEALDASMAQWEFDSQKKHVDEMKKETDANKDYSDETRATLTDGIKDLQNELKTTSLWVEQTIKVDKLVKDLKIETIDVDKALKTLEIDAKHKAKLAKILNGPSSGYEKGLTALAKELKLGTDGKAMLAELKKAGVL